MFGALKLLNSIKISSSGLKNSISCTVATMSGYSGMSHDSSDSFSNFEDSQVETLIKRTNHRNFVVSDSSEGVGESGEDFPEDVDDKNPSSNAGNDDDEPLEIKPMMRTMVTRRLLARRLCHHPIDIVHMRNLLRGYIACL